ncbi:hypothetical protein DL93DRAFT_2077772 [Clavulina sp. PMI_390]|nr:hypothetical protein DL93DRAFT_2077772 [Clavulina sp. PMI_390]
MSVAMINNTATSFSKLLEPIPPFDAPTLPNVSALDILGAMRLSIVVRQLRRQGGGPQGSAMWWHDLWLTMVVVFGGEMIAAAMLTTPASFMLSPTVPLMFVASHVIAQFLPDMLIPLSEIQTELPLALLDAMTRSMLVCDGVASMVKQSPNPALRASPMALLFTSTVLGNGGFFFVNVFGMLSPSGWAVSTPPELGPYGWTTTDLWVAPAMSALYATLTHLQPFWLDVQRTIFAFLGEAYSPPFLHHLGDGAKDAFFVMGEGVMQPVDPVIARSVCALIMMGLFGSRAVKNFWGVSVERKVASSAGKPKAVAGNAVVTAPAPAGAPGSKKRAASGAPKTKKE